MSSTLTGGTKIGIMDNVGKDLYSEEDVKAIVGGFVGHLGRLGIVNVKNAEDMKNLTLAFADFWSNQKDKLIYDVRNKTQRWQDSRDAAVIVVDAMKNL